VSGLPRKTRSDKGKKRIGQKIRSAALNTAKYGAGLYVGSKIYGAGSKAGTAITNRLASRIAPNAAPGSLIDRGKTLGKTVGAIVVADQTVRGVGRLTDLAKRKREERLERKGKPHGR
jgi:hypothetical protein